MKHTMISNCLLIQSDQIILSEDIEPSLKFILFCSFFLSSIKVLPYIKTERFEWVLLSKNFRLSNKDNTFVLFYNFLLIGKSYQEFVVVFDSVKAVGKNCFTHKKTQLFRILFRIKHTSRNFEIFLSIAWVYVYTKF